MKAMHEMSIAMNIVEIAVQTAAREKARKISTIELEIGPLAGVTVDALTFCFEAASRDTPAQGAELQIHSKKIFGRCLSCDLEHEILGFCDQCRECGGLLTHPQEGDGMRITAITVDDDAAGDPPGAQA